MVMETLDHYLNVLRQMDHAYDQYEWMLDLGIRAPSFPEICQDIYKIPGCKTSIWLEIQSLEIQSLEIQGLEIQGLEQQVQIKTDSDSLLVKGILSPLMELHTRESAEEMIYGFLQLLELVDENVIHRDIRDNGLAQVLSQIRTALRETPSQK